MTLDEYQELAHKTAVYPLDKGIEYTALGLVGEAGEYANKVKKILRGDSQIDDLEHVLANELGDILWYVSECASMIGYTLNHVAEGNISKLQIRSLTGTLKGSGDDR